MSIHPPEHSIVITNFVSIVHSQLKDSVCKVFPDNVEYRWILQDGTEKRVIPDCSINCHIKGRKGNSFINAPQFVLEVLSPSSIKRDREEKMEIYRSEEIPEYWLVDWQNKSVEIYILDYNENDEQREQR